jgi:SPP1 gp7 family putative phage head morphogenesis protein
MTPLERAILRQRRALLRIEQNGARQIVSTYAAVEQRLKESVDLLTREITHARAQGFEVRPGWLFAQQRYRQLLVELQHSTLDFLHQALTTITTMQAAAIARAPDDAERLIFATMGPAPRRDIAALRATFGKLPAAALHDMIGRASNGQPLGDLLGEIVPDAVDAVRHSLAYGVATGQNPRVIADDVMVRSGMSRTRALSIARTETLGAYREVSKQRFGETKIVETWTWLAAVDARTCPACAAMNGTIHPVTGGLESHPNCRCVAAPNTPSWADLGFTGIPDNRPAPQTPEERFDALSEADRLAILGRARLDAYSAGKITLADLVQETHSPKWGKGRTTATLTSLGLRI